MSFGQVLFLFAPMFVANATPVVVALWPGLRSWNTPIAPGLLGKNKTWRGLICGVGFGTLFACGQWYWAQHMSFNESVLAGFLVSLGALLGDAAESAFKRQLGLAPGKALPVLDGIDYVVGAILCLSPIYLPSPIHIVMLLLLGPVLSLLANLFSYSVGWKEVWW